MKAHYCFRCDADTPSTLEIADQCSEEIRCTVCCAYSWDDGLELRPGRYPYWD